MTTSNPDLVASLAISPSKFAKEYISLPMLPYGKTIRIDKIRCYNYNAVTKQHQGYITYRPFRLECPQEFPLCQNPQNDYEDNEQVGPIVVTSGDTNYKVKMVLWFPLSDIVGRIIIKQSKLGRKLFPIHNVFIDEEDQFMVKLFNV